MRTGTHHGLTLVLDTNIDEYYCGSTSSPGFKVVLEGYSILTKNERELSCNGHV
ncbi:unnamed protein product [Plutella xylostella]|uniref:(diamondback moth) hypothetical protein n=1 Tax=Plutella xylostella TaxID=51655 RepID=A0A8S4DTL7_PLUXY|nr:unnamed protein product [Plutella xylostella]